jgi:DNA-directed RNA polymerase specialized sigma24 family protein
MDPEKTNTANNGLEWMLQNTSVDDSSLAAALVSSYYQQIYSLAYHLLDKHPGSAEKAAQEAIAAAVRERHRLSIETSLRAWLFAYIYRRCRQANDRPFLKSINLPFFPRSKSGQGFYLDGELEGVPSKYAFALALNDIYDFSLSEAAFVQEISTKAAEERLIAARAAAYNHFYPEKLNPVDHLGYIDLLYRGAENLDYAESGEVRDHLTDCPVCQAYAERLPDLERRLASAADNTSQQVPTQDLEAGSQAVMTQIGLSQKSRRSSLPFKEIGLVGAIVITLVLFGNWLELFTPPGAHPTLTQAAPTPTHTPTANSLSPVFLEGEEGLDYFFFTYASFQVDGFETFETISEKIGLAPDDIRYLNGLEPGSDRTIIRNREIKLAALRDSGWFDPPPRSTQRLLAPPLTSSSSVDQVIDRIRESEAYWQTMWGEYMYLIYPFPGYLALPEIIYFFQYWFAGPELSAFTAAGPGEAEGFTGFQAGSWAFHSDAGGYRGFWQSQREWGFLPLFGNDIEDIFGHMDFQVGKTGTLAGRGTISLLGEIDDGFGILELWVDALTGVILGYEVNSPGGEIIMASLRANRIEYDVQLPPGLFYPPTSPLEGLSSGYRADPIENIGLIPIDWTSIGLPEYIETLQPPPPDLDIARSSILFQNRDLSESSVEIFADGYYLGSLELPPNLRSCQRSPDGMNAILTTTSNVFFSEGTEHYLINLFTLEMMKIAEVQEYQGVRFAFSPDNTRLANLTCAFPCRLFILDLETGESRKVGRDYSYLDAVNLAWSPDGGQIAFMFSDNPSYGQVFVLDVETGEEIFSSNYHVLNEKILTPGSPTEKWGIPYPPEEKTFPCNQPFIP